MLPNKEIKYYIKLIKTKQITKVYENARYLLVHEIYKFKR